jgi:hypothetical protein
MTGSRFDFDRFYHWNPQSPSMSSRKTLAFENVMKEVFVMLVDTRGEEHNKARLVFNKHLPK